MSFAGVGIPATARTDVSWVGGASGLAGASSLSRTAETMRMVAVAWTAAGAGQDCGADMARKAAAIGTMSNMPNAVAGIW